MDASTSALLAWLAPIVSTLIICAGQLAINATFKKAEARRDEAHVAAEQKREEERAATEQKREAEREWRIEISSRIEQQDEKIDAVLSAQCSQIRSDIIHKCHRYLDDLGMASIEEKQSLHAEHEDYQQLCDANDIVNHFIDNLVAQVMELPTREESHMAKETHQGGAH